MRGESGRVATRVRSLLEEHGGPRAEPAAGRSPEPRPSQPGLWARLAARVPARVDPGRRVAIAVGVAVAVAAVVTGAWVLAARPRALPVSSVPPVGAISGVGSAGASAASRQGSSPGHGSSSGGDSSPSASGDSASGPADLIVVDVAGEVRHPGVYRLPAGSRVDDAVRAAGGAMPRVKLDSLNLAAKLIDGQQVAVAVPASAGGVAGGVSGAAAGGGAVPGGGPVAGTPNAPVDLNSAGLEQLQTLPGVGPVLGQHILDWRAAHGRFASIDQLDDVPGIGEVKFAALKPLVSV